MEYIEYLRKPFVVRAVEVTTENIHEVAEFVGTVREKEDKSGLYIQVDRTLIPNLDRVYPGFFLTKMGNNFRCYSPRAFREQFTESTPEAEAWMHFLREKDELPAKSGK